MYVCMHILIDGLREMNNADVNVSSSLGDTTQNVRTAAGTSNTEAEVPSTDQSMYTMCIQFALCISASALLVVQAIATIFTICIHMYFKGKFHGAYTRVQNKHSNLFESIILCLITP